jgi:hypothetical protein
MHYPQIIGTPAAATAQGTRIEYVCRNPPKDALLVSMVLHLTKCQWLLEGTQAGGTVYTVGSISRSFS